MKKYKIKKNKNKYFQVVEIETEIGDLVFMIWINFEYFSHFFLFLIIIYYFGLKELNERRNFWKF